MEVLYSFPSLVPAFPFLVSPPPLPLPLLSLVRASFHQLQNFVTVPVNYLNRSPEAIPSPRHIQYHSCSIQGHLFPAHSSPESLSPCSWHADLVMAFVDPQGHYSHLPQLLPPPSFAQLHYDEYTPVHQLDLDPNDIDLS